MEQITHKDIETLGKILANPADTKYEFSLDLQSLIDEFPQAGIFRALIARKGNQENIRHSAVYFPPSALYKLIHSPDSLPIVTAAQIVRVGDAPLPVDEDSAFVSQPLSDEFQHDFNMPPFIVEDNYMEVEDDDVNQDIDAAEGREDHYPFIEKKDVGTPYDSAEEHSPNKAETHTDQNPEVVEAMPKFQPWQQPQSYHEDTDSDKLPKQQEQIAEYSETVDAPVNNDQITGPGAENIAESEEAPEPVYPNSEKTEYFHQDIDDEIYDEIVSIEDINLEQLAGYQAEPRNVVVTETLNEIHTTDHFIFQPELLPEEEIDDVEITAPEIPAIIIPANEIALPPVTDRKSNVSMYNDEKLPYTFMWWLDKTRKDHASTYQPYATEPAHNEEKSNNEGRSYKVEDPYIDTEYTGTTINNAYQGTVDELQQQYVENIFTISAIDELEKHNKIKTTGNATERKEDIIIRRFIETEPQIKNSGDAKLDNENKAKKSSEDSNELITETLARIYMEQMLYSKAIAAYKKLMLKFPEKSLYFASQIEQLQKKPN